MNPPPPPGGGTKRNVCVGSTRRVILLHTSVETSPGRHLVIWVSLSVLAFFKGRGPENELFPQHLVDELRIVTGANIKGALAMKCWDKRQNAKFV